MVRGFDSECSNDDAHRMLYDFRRTYKRWQERNTDNKLPRLTRQLKYFEALGVGAGRIKQVDINCKRFLLKVENNLSQTDSRFRIIYDNYWDTWGQVVGQLLRKKRRERKLVRASLVLANLRMDFSGKDWSDRELAVRGFKQVAEQSQGYDGDIWNMLAYFCVCCKAAMSGIIGPLPSPICNAISWIVQSQNSIAERLAKGKLEVADCDNFLLQLLNSVILSLQFIIRASNSAEFDQKDTWVCWRKIILEYLFSEDLLENGEKKKVSKKVKKAFGDFIGRIRQLRRQGKDKNMGFLLEEFQESCSQMFNKCLQVGI